MSVTHPVTDPTKTWPLAGVQSGSGPVAGHIAPSNASQVAAGRARSTANDGAALLAGSTDEPHHRKAARAAKLHRSGNGALSSSSTGGTAQRLAAPARLAPRQPPYVDEPAHRQRSADAAPAALVNVPRCTRRGGVVLGPSYALGAPGRCRRGCSPDIGRRRSLASGVRPPPASAKCCYRGPPSPNRPGFWRASCRRLKTRSGLLRVPRELLDKFLRLLHDTESQRREVGQPVHLHLGRGDCADRARVCAGQMFGSWLPETELEDPPFLRHSASAMR